MVGVSRVGRGFGLFVRGVGMVGVFIVGHGYVWSI